MVTQKLISFKVDVDQLDYLDSVTSLIGFNRNKFINYALSFALDAVKSQLEVALDHHLDPKLINFIN